jgi:protein N-terminal amidase
VTVGYPEVAQNPTDISMNNYYNSAVTINAHGEIIANYRKTFLYYTDETWASEGPKFFSGRVPNLGNVVMGICKFPS